ncbi:MAG: radical SAM protein [Coriobacteriales bacterium]|jgi:biotin synthase
MKLDIRANGIISRAYEGQAASKEECVYLLNFDPKSPEAFAIRAAAASIIRDRTDNTAVIFGQIGVECSPCPADCDFCSFAKSTTGFQPMRLTDDEIVEKINGFCKGGDLYGLWLMTMHEYDLDYYLHVLRLAREHVSPETNIYTNVGDTSYEDFCKMKEAGADGVYHICRLGEGVHTNLRPEDRLQTMENAKRAGLDTLDAVEPIGPEHTPEELVEKMFLTKRFKSIQTGSMKRIAVPGTPFENMGEINHFKLSQIVSVQCLALLDMDPLPWIGIHEPCEAGYMSGANLISAETGVNPRDTATDTSAGRGLDMDASRRILYDAGFEYLCKGDGTRVPLTMEYIEGCCE